MIDHTPGSAGFHLEVEGESHNRRAFWCLDGDQLPWTRNKRLTTKVRPNVTGRVVGSALLDIVDLELRYEFDGAYDLMGAASSDPEETLGETLDWFTANVADATGRLAVTVTGKGGAAWAGDLVVTDFRRGDGLEDCNAILFVTLPDGLLAPVGS